MEEPAQWKIILKTIWPTVYRIINGFLYFLLTLIKTIVSMAVSQLKGL